MQKRQTRIALIILLLFSVLSTAVYAQSFDILFKTIENLIPKYGTYYYAIDAILYFIILIGAAQFALSKQFEGRGGKAVIIGVGVSLALAAAFFEKRTGFKLVEGLGPFAFITVFVIFILLAYFGLTKVGANARLTGMIIFSVGYFYLNTEFPSIGTWAISKGGWLALSWALLDALAIICFIWAIIEGIGKLVSSSGVGEVVGDVGRGIRDYANRNPPPRNPPAPPAPPGTPVPTPQFTRATGADGGVILEWNNPGGVQGYEIHRQGAGRRARRAFIQNITNPVQTVYFDRVPPGTYTYFIRGVLGGNGSNDSNPINGTPLAARANVYFMPVAGGGGGIAAYWVSLTRPAGGAPSFSNANIGNAFTLYMMAPGGTGIYPIHLNIGAPPAWNFAGVIAQGQFHAISILNLAPPDRVIQPGSVCIADTHSLV